MLLVAIESIPICCIVPTDGVTGIVYYIRKNGLDSGSPLSTGHHPVWNPSGLVYDQILPSSPVLWNECRRLAMELSELRELGLLYRPTQPDYASGPNGMKVAVQPSTVHGTVRVDRCGGVVVLLANTLNEPTAVRVSVEPSSMYSGAATVLFEQRQVAVKLGAFDDVVDGYGSRVYSLGEPHCPAHSSAGIIKSNLLVNPSLEESVNAGWPLGFEAYDHGDHGATMFRDGSRSTHGRYSARLTTPTPGRGLHISLAPVASCGEDADGAIRNECQDGLLAELWLYAVAQKPGLQLTLGAMHSAAPYIFPPQSSTVCNLSTTWAKCSVPVFSLPNSTTQIGVWVELLSAGTAWIDLVQLTVMGGAQPR